MCVARCSKRHREVVRSSRVSLSQLITLMTFLKHCFNLELFIFRQQLTYDILMHWCEFLVRVVIACSMTECTYAESRIATKSYLRKAIVRVVLRSRFIVSTRTMRCKISAMFALNAASHMPIREGKTFHLVSQKTRQWLSFVRMSTHCFVLQNVILQFFVWKRRACTHFQRQSNVRLFQTTHFDIDLSVTVLGARSLRLSFMDLYPYQSKRPWETSLSFDQCITKNSVHLFQTAKFQSCGTHNSNRFCVQALWRTLDINLSQHVCGAWRRTTCQRSLYQLNTEINRFGLFTVNPVHSVNWGCAFRMIAFLFFSCDRNVLVCCWVLMETNQFRFVF